VPAASVARKDLRLIYCNQISIFCSQPENWSFRWWALVHPQLLHYSVSVGWVEFLRFHRLSSLLSCVLIPLAVVGHWD
jgi:hypothetical protein